MGAVSLARPKKPGSRAHLQRTPAQETAFRVFRLRGLWWSLFGGLTGERLQHARALIDAELADLGAETQSARWARQKREIDERLAQAGAARNVALEELPF